MSESDGRLPIRFPCSSDENTRSKQSLVQRVVDVFKKKNQRCGASQSSLSEVMTIASLKRGGSIKSNLMQETMEIPPDFELDSLFVSVMRETLGEDKVMDVMKRLTKDSKWQMICQTGRVEELHQGRYSPDYFIQVLSEGSNRNDESSACFDQDLVAALRIQLTNQPLSWIREFHARGGIIILAQSLQKVFHAKNHKTQKGLISEWLRASRAFTNNHIGLEEAARNEDFMNSLCLHINDSDLEMRLVPIHIFTVIAYTSPPETAMRIINSMSYLQHVLEEERRFDSFIQIMTSNCRELQQTIRDPNRQLNEKVLASVVDGLIFINSILDNLDDYEVRIHIRNQIYRRPFRAEFEALRGLNDQSIARQLEIFNTLLQTDAEWLMEQYSRQPKSFINANDLFEILLESLKGSEGVTVLTQFLQHVLCVRADASIRTRYIRFLDATLETLLLSNKGLDPDFCSSPVPYLSFKELDRLLNTNPIDTLRQENLRLQFQLTSLQDNQHAFEVERDALITSLRCQITNLTSRLENDQNQSKRDLEAAKIEMEAVNTTLRDDLQKAQERITDLEAQFLVSIPADEVRSPKLVDIETSESKGLPKIPATPPFIPNISELGPPLSPSLPPPPPPPPGIRKPSIKPSNIYPPPARKLKAMQWKKILAKEITGTLWEKADLSKFGNSVDFNTLERLFEVQKSEDRHANNASSDGSKTSIVSHILTVDNKIMISILLGKSPYDEHVLAKALEEMDDKIFTPRLCAQFRKSFWEASKDGNERPLIEEEAYRELMSLDGETKDVTEPAERILIKLATVRGFPYRIKFIGSKIDVVDLCNSINSLLDPFFAVYDRIKSSERFRKILWLILYIGNYVNQGSSRGDAPGFNFEYITSLKPLKGCEPDSNMLNYLVGLIMNEFPDLLEVITDLELVTTVKEMKFRDIEDLIGRFKEATETTKAIVDGYKAFPPLPNQPAQLDQTNDTFLSVIKAYLDFLEASQSLIMSRIEQLQVTKAGVLKYLAESSTMTAETLFSIFYEFLTDFESSRRLLENKELALQRERRLSNAKKSEGRSKVAGMINNKSDQRGVVDNVLATLRLGRRSPATPA